MELHLPPSPFRAIDLPSCTAKCFAVSTLLEILDSLLESIGVQMGWYEKLQLLQLLPGVEAVYHAVSGRILVKRVG